MMSGGKSEYFIFINLGDCIGEAKKKSFKSQLKNLAPFLASEITLLRSIFTSRSMAARDDASSEHTDQSYPLLVSLNMDLTSEGNTHILYLHM